MPELDPLSSEPLIEKSYGDSFEEVSLEEVLENLVGERLFVAGAQTDACIRLTLHGALTRGHDGTLVREANTTEDLTQWVAPPE